MLLNSVELNLFSSNSTLIGGLDEAGRGPWAGPVTSALVILDKKAFLALQNIGIDDSKLIKESKRKILSDQIKKIAVEFQIFDISHEDIDSSNILIATQKSMNIAFKSSKMKASKYLVDGYFNKAFEFKNSECIIDGDAKYLSIAAASILAKVHRDELMIEYSKIYPNYGFEKHKGYGTKLHSDALREFGVCDIHRRSFKPIKKYINGSN